MANVASLFLRAMLESHPRRQIMAKVILYRPDKNEQFPGASDISIEHGVLSFYWKPNSMDKTGKKITTTVPFYVEEDGIGM
jgi:hypothetical protein